jgi:predicted nucleotidyltransferase
MTTARSEELRALARRFIGLLPADIDEALLTGSVSRGEADELSDVEMLLVARATAPHLSALGIEMWQEDFFENGTVAWYTALFEGEVLEMAGWTHARVEGRLEGILSGQIIDHGRFRFAEALVHGIPLRSAGEIERWQARLAKYPEALVEAIVHDASEEWLEHPLGVRAHLRSGGRLALAAMLADDLQNVLRIVFALNRVWEPSWKRLPQLVAPLAVKPERLAERIDEAVAETSLRKTRELVLDTLLLAPGLPRVVLARNRTARLLRELA